VLDIVRASRHTSIMKDELSKRQTRRKPKGDAMIKYRMNTVFIAILDKLDNDMDNLIAQSNFLEVYKNDPRLNSYEKKYLGVLLKYKQA
jgi:hypothetical protein